MFFRSGKSPSRSQSGSCIVSKTMQQCMFSRGLLSLYQRHRVLRRNQKLVRYAWMRNIVPQCSHNACEAQSGRQHRRQRARVQKVHKCVSDVCRVECIVVIIVQVPRFERAEICAAATLETPSSTNASSRSIRCSPMTVIGFAVTISAKENTSKSHLYTPDRSSLASGYVVSI